MKTKIFMGALVALLAVACAKEQLPEQKETTAEGLAVTASVEQPGDGTKTSLDGLSVKWSVGDKIYLTDGTHTATYEATTASSSTSFKYVSGDTTLDGDVYAYYPADNVSGFSAGAFTATIPAVQPYVAGGFADGINPMTAKATVEDGSLVLSFKNVMSFVKLQIADSDADGKILRGLSLTSPSAALSGTATVTVAPDGTATTAVSGSNAVALSGVNVPLAVIAAPLYIAVPTGNLGKLTITAKTSESDGMWAESKTASSALVAGRSNINSYQPMQISSFTEGRTRLTESPANCYMVDATKQTAITIPLSQAIDGWTAIKALEPETDLAGMVTKITSGERSIAVRWFDGAGGSITLDETGGINDDNMTLLFKDCSNGANAAVDLKNGDVIVWSWHIWFTDYKPAATNENTLNGQVHGAEVYPSDAFKAGGLYYGKVMMDRNLGAIVTGVSKTVAISQPTTNDKAAEFFGLYYQFGRKDPFARTGNVDKCDVTIVKKLYADAAKDPGTFYSTNGNQGSATSDGWCATDVGASPITDPWCSNGTKSAFDPCPAGWRIPKNDLDALSNVWAGITTDTWKKNVEGHSRTCGHLLGNAWIPCAHSFREMSSGSLGGSLTSGFYWCAAPRVEQAGRFSSLAEGKITPATDVNGSRAHAMNVRCVTE